MSGEFKETVISGSRNTRSASWSSATVRLFTRPSIFPSPLRHRVGGADGCSRSRDVALSREKLLFRGHTHVVDADFADYCGETPSPTSVRRIRAWRCAETGTRKNAGCYWNISDRLKQKTP